VIVFEAWEQMALVVERHLDRAVAEQRLQPLGPHRSSRRFVSSA